MAARRPVLASIVAVVSALALAGPALAAPPQTIYRDLADNGKLDRRYSQDDLARAFNLRRVMGTDEGAPATPRPRVTQPTSPTSTRSERLPFTGLDIALLSVGGAPLLLIGAMLRRRLAPPARPTVVEG